MKKARKIELLAPAKDLECGIEAINHGADAVYIGAPKFGARAAAGNSVDDIRKLSEYAHLFGCKVYVALNTILNDRELRDVELLIWQLYDEARIDALIIQDMGITELNLPPIALHASTQNDNRTAEKAKFMEDAGFKQIVLARELSLEDIYKIAQQISTPLEVFVHGALCVSYSGQCYLSQALSGRSANKGECAQYCRLPYSLVDSQGEEVISKKHLLSMKDLNLSGELEHLLQAGVSSFKIEGRLKDVSYVKNVVAYYRKKLDVIFSHNQQYVRSSSGYSTYTFDPDLSKSFNRGFTKYFANGRVRDIWSIDSPKSMGEKVGVITEVTTKYLRVRGERGTKLNNGDGLCFLNNKREMEGIQVNRAEGDCIYPFVMPEIKKGTSVYRNYDHEFEKILSKKSAERKIRVEIELKDLETGYSLEATDEDGYDVNLNVVCDKQLANKDQVENIRTNLRKTGNTIFEIEKVTINTTSNWFIPVSQLSEWRRQLTDKLLSVRQINYKQQIVSFVKTSHAYPITDITYLGNVMNEKSKLFYERHGAKVKEYAFEKEKQEDVALMFTKHCIKQSLGWCPKEDSGQHPYKEPFFLEYKQTKLRLAFDCKNCEMKVYHTTRTD